MFRHRAKLGTATEFQRHRPHVPEPVVRPSRRRPGGRRCRRPADQRAGAAVSRCFRPGRSAGTACAQSVGSKDSVVVVGRLVHRSDSRVAHLRHPGPAQTRMDRAHDTRRPPLLLQVSHPQLFFLNILFETRGDVDRA